MNIEKNRKEYGWESFLPETREFTFFERPILKYGLTKEPIDYVEAWTDIIKYRCFVRFENFIWKRNTSISVEAWANIRFVLCLTGAGLSRILVVKTNLNIEKSRKEYGGESFESFCQKISIWILNERCLLSFLWMDKFQNNNLSKTCWADCGLLDERLSCR